MPINLPRGRGRPRNPEKMTKFISITEASQEKIRGLAALWGLSMTMAVDTIIADAFKQITSAEAAALKVLRSSRRRK